MAKGFGKSPARLKPPKGTFSTVLAKNAAPQKEVAGNKHF
jgi:hypothetical protein